MSQTTLPGSMASWRQGDGPHFRLGDQAALGPALGEDVVGVAEHDAGRDEPRRSGRPGLRFRIITFSGANSISADSASSPCVTRSSGPPRFSQT